MATGINRVHFLIAILCIAFVFTQGGSIDAPPTTKYCITEVKCPNNDKACNDYCLKIRFPGGGKCESNNMCCCEA
ncbi:LCR-like protein [Medicago truncatula]|uniref:LCR-like protein n=1 Tax=Medicago truncatula TaxID=3880 RepID=A0A072VBQ0_MEDTR|nr:LCR-like protein [Medicago truncatula]